jgi:hypothetical protein
MVEFQLPETGWCDLQATTAQARQATNELRREGAEVRFLRLIFVPEHRACFFLYEGSSEQAVTDAARRARLGIRRVAAALQLDTDEGETS